MAEELDNELENQDISTEEFDDDVESDPEEDRLYSMSDEELEKEFIKAKSEARQQVKREPNKDIAEGDVDDDADNDDTAESEETEENSESDGLAFIIPARFVQLRTYAGSRLVVWNYPGSEKDPYQ